MKVIWMKKHIFVLSITIESILIYTYFGVLFFFSFSFVFYSFLHFKLFLLEFPVLITLYVLGIHVLL